MSDSRLAFSYLAFSTPQQSEGRSTDRQHGAALAWCDANGFRLAPSRQYCDEGVSRYNGRARMKGKLSQFLALCGTAAVPAGSVFIVEDFDRLSRENPDDAWELFRGILLAGVEIVVLSLGRWFKKESLHRFEDRLLVQACQYRAHQESATKALRQKDIWADRRKRAAENPRNGTPTKLPSWMMRDEAGVVVLIPEREETLRLMVSWALSGLGGRRIAGRLTAGPDARPCWLSGGEWDGDTVKKILRRPALFGAYQPARMNEKREMVPTGGLVRDFYPAVISEDDARLVGRAMAKRTKERGRTSKHDRNVLRGVARCAETGGALRLKYSCRTVFLDRRWQGRTQAVVPYDVLEEIVLRAVQEWKPDALSGPGPDDGGPDRCQALLDELDQIAEDRAATEKEFRKPGRASQTAAFLAGRLDDLVAREAQVREELTEAQAGRPLAALLTEARSVIEVYRGLPEGERPEARRRLNLILRDLLAGVWVYRQRWTVRTGEVIVQVWPRAGEPKVTRFILGLPPAGWQPLDVTGVDFRAGYAEPLRE